MITAFCWWRLKKEKDPQKKECEKHGKKKADAKFEETESEEDAGDSDKKKDDEIELADDAEEKYPPVTIDVNTRLHKDGSVMDQ